MHGSIPSEFGFGPPEPPRRPRRGWVYVLVMLAGVAGAVGLFAGALNLLMGHVANLTPQAEQRHEAATGVPDEAATLSGTARGLAEELDHVHEGIDVDWDASAARTGTGIDEGQVVDSAPGIFMVDTMMMGFYGTGTGMVLTADGIAVTNYHVVENSTDVVVRMADTDIEYNATVLGRDSEHDVAVLQIEDAPELPVTSLNLSTPQIGDINAAVGNGGGQGYLTSVVGEVTALDKTILAGTDAAETTSRLTGLIETTADVVPGYSGGPLVDRDGQVIGVSTAASPGETTEEVNGYAIPIAVALEIVNQVLSGEETETVSIGVDGALGITILTTDDGPDIQEVTPDSAAEELGLRAGDLIISVEGETVTTSSELARAINDRNVGDLVEVVWRDASGATQTGTATLQEAVVN
ncbi:S1C family serine protease [Citricoccus muralis]|uniref:Trypsin-like peptidase domain-containing protein n=1 Tax=Citricoccus muralis TaxID=169134 RepID=A0ABY8H3W1_9MICC|nr:trypsin-like peptidase domain-containing protein [Citricoccus muralis]WFP15706.1 trypsin-like peptidase domain-containing protein [Citricoccus muralis]